MGFGSYLKTRIADFLFCLIAASGLTYTLFSGFYATQPLQASVWPAVLPCAAVLALVFCVAYNARTAVIGSIALAFALAGAVALCAAGNPGATVVDDVEGNHALAVIIVALVSVLVFLLSRRYGLSIALVVAGLVACSLIEYLYWHGHVVALAVFLVGAVGLVVLKAYQSGLARSDTEQLAFTSVSIMAIAATACALLVGFGVYKLVIEPLDPPRAQITVIVEHRRVEEIRIVGTGSTSSDTGGDSGNEANGDVEQSNQGASALLRDTVQNGVQSVLGMADDAAGNTGATTSLDIADYTIVFVMLLIVLLVVAVIVARKLVRHRNFVKMTNGTGEAAVRNLYLFFLSRFSRMKVPHPDNLTPTEYYDNFASTFSYFERHPAVGGANFGTLTDIFVRTTFGQEAVTDEELRAYKGYYRVFYRNARRYVGRFKYLFKFFRL